MTAGSRSLSLQEFLLAYVLGGDDDIEIDYSTGPADPWVQGLGLENSDLDRLPGSGRSLRAEVERHSEQTTTVVFRGRAETVTRCSACPSEEYRPCMALRVLALPYARHPAYRSEWGIAPPDAASDVQVEESPAATGTLLALPQQRNGDELARPGTLVTAESSLLPD